MNKKLLLRWHECLGKIRTLHDLIGKLEKENSQLKVKIEMMEMRKKLEEYEKMDNMFININ